MTSTSKRTDREQNDRDTRTDTSRTEPKPATSYPEPVLLRGRAGSAPRAGRKA